MRTMWYWVFVLLSIMVLESSIHAYFSGVKVRELQQINEKLDRIDPHCLKPFYTPDEQGNREPR